MHTPIAKYSLSNGAQTHRYLGLGGDGVNVICARAELHAPVQQVNLSRVVRQRQRFLQRRISAADDDHVLSLKERSVAVSALRHSLPFKLGFTGNAKPLDLRA